MLDGLLAAQLPRPYAEFLVTILGYFKAGYAERLSDSVQAITGKVPRGFAQYAKDYRASWQGWLRSLATESSAVIFASTVCRKTKRQICSIFETAAAKRYDLADRQYSHLTMIPERERQ